MAATLALAGDTMLGRGVADVLERDPGVALVSGDVVEVVEQADAFVLNLECCISSRGERFRDPHKPFYFRAPAVAAERLAALGVTAVSLANNHALDYGEQALLDTIEHLDAAGVASVGAGADAAAARRPQVIRCGDLPLRIVAVSDHPEAYAATGQRAGIAFAALGAELPPWLRQATRAAADADAVLVTPHWGPNMVAAPIPRVRAAADALLAAGASLVAGHSAHVFQGVRGPVIYDLGDFLDDYATDAELRNDLGLLWLVEFDGAVARRISALPLSLGYAFTRIATGTDASWIRRRLTHLCGRLGSEVRVAPDGLLEVVRSAE